MPHRFRLFEAFGVELEYMIVDRATLRVMPVCDRLLTQAAQRPGAEASFEDDSKIPTEVALGPVSWSNELASHVVEFKTTEPARSLADLPALFHESVALANVLLAPMGAMLLPTAMHPTMDPDREMKLWPHGFSEVYATFNRIFDCRGHGWANLQAAHLNLPFSGDEEFGRLHGAIRALLPLMPALSAASPIMDGRTTGTLDNRMEVYRANSRRIPSVAGRVVPEPVFTEADYRAQILQKIYDDLAPMDPEGILRDEWVNARGCIARFSRGAIEVRVLDVQECPAADVAICATIAAAVRALATGTLGSLDRLARIPTERLHAVLLQTIRSADSALIDDHEYLRCLGLDPGSAPSRAADLWRTLIDQTIARDPDYPRWRPALDTITSEGTLAARTLRALGGDLSPSRIGAVYAELSSCLAQGRMFHAAHAEFSPR